MKQKPEKHPAKKIPGQATPISNPKKTVQNPTVMHNNKKDAKK